jgi:hypothetical protein
MLRRALLKLSVGVSLEVWLKNARSHAVREKKKGGFL